MKLKEIVNKYSNVLFEDKNNIYIKKNVPLIELFELYSDIVHYIDNELVSKLEEIIKNKIINKEF